MSPRTSCHLGGFFSLRLQGIGVHYTISLPDEERKVCVGKIYNNFFTKEKIVFTVLVSLTLATKKNLFRHY